MLEWRVKQRATRWPWTTRSWRSRPTRSTPSCPRRWPARSTEILVEPDETVAVGTVLCRIEAGRRRAGRAGARRPSRAGGRPTATAAPAPPATATPTPRRWPPAWPARTASTSARVSGSGPRGRVTKDDVQAAIAGNGAPGARAPRRPAGGDRADPRPRGHARPLHGREPLDPHRHQLPHARRWTRSTRRRSELKARRQEALASPT